MLGARRSPKIIPKITCGGCDARWTGLNAAHCSACHQTFSGIALFDMHRVIYACKDPTKVKHCGLPLRLDNGVWRSSHVDTRWNHRDTIR